MMMNHDGPIDMALENKISREKSRLIKRMRTIYDGLPKYLEQLRRSGLSADCDQSRGRTSSESSITRTDKIRVIVDYDA